MQEKQGDRAIVGLAYATWHMIFRVLLQAFFATDLNIFGNEKSFRTRALWVASIPFIPYSLDQEAIDVADIVPWVLLGLYFLFKAIEAIETYSPPPVGADTPLTIRMTIMTHK